MYKKMDDAALTALLEVGISEFAYGGFDRVSISQIAKKAGISVGVIYKYYKDKDAFILACIHHSLKLVDKVQSDLMNPGLDLKEALRILVDDILISTVEHPTYHLLYHEITAGTSSRFARCLAEAIEGKTARLYTQLFEKAKAEGIISVTESPEQLAFIFDNLLMMFHFSLTTNYYQERLKIFCGEDILEHREELADSLMSFMTRALGIR